MVNTIKVINFQSVAECRFLQYQSTETFLPINYQFVKGNLYGFVSDFGCGSWGLATSLGGRCCSFSGKVMLNDIEILPSKLLEHSCFVAEIHKTDINKTAKQCIKKALSTSHISYSTEVVKEKFHLTNERFDRKLKYVSGEVWNASLAIGFATGKDVFLFPWLNINNIARFQTAVELGIIDFLKSEGKIIIVPSSNEDILKKYCDCIIKFEPDKFAFYNI